MSVMVCVEKGHVYIHPHYYLQDGNKITELTLTVLNLPVNLTDIECVYRINAAASLDSVEAPTTTITRYDAATGTVGCLVPTTAKRDLLNICKLNKAVLTLGCRQIIILKVVFSIRV